jgi:anti-sigma28 factor (negative regulator of flagellin synthesis)
MKVESNLLNISMPQTDRVQEAAKNADRIASRTQSLPSANDGVNLGNQAGLVAAAQTAGQTDQASTVQRLRALIQSGHYQVDTTALSESMVAAAGSGY